MKAKIFVGLLVGIACILFHSAANAFQVSPLPPGNLLVNPWFRSTENPTLPGFDGWTRVLQNNVGWGPSQKESNPSPDIVVSGTCSFEPVYCGTAARWAEQQGDFYPGMDAYLYQVVQANPGERNLRFSAYWVTHRVEIAEVTIYGANAANGPWTKLWVPFSHTQDTNPPLPPGGAAELWEHTGMMEMTLIHGFGFYKVEIHGRYPQPLPNGGMVGYKITGVYFTTESESPSNGSYIHLPILYSPGH